MPTIEQNLERIADALEKLADAATGGMVQLSKPGAADPSLNPKPNKDPKPPKETPDPKANSHIGEDEEDLTPVQKAARTRKRKKEEAAAKAAEEANEAEGDGEEEEAVEVDLGVLRAKLGEVSTEYGRDALVGLLSRFGVGALKALDEEQYGAVYNMACEALEHGEHVIMGGKLD